MALIYDQSGFGSSTNRTEWGGIQDGQPPLSSCLQQSSSFGTLVPPNGCSLMQMIRVSPSDGPYFSTTGIRCLTREAEPFPRRSAGYEEWQVWACLLPTGYPGDANMYISGFEHHHQGDGVAPSHWIFTSSGLSLDCYGGSTAAGGIGNPGRTTTYSHSFTGSYYTQRNRWYVCMVHYKHDPTNGQFEGYIGLQGTDTAIASITGPQSGPTMFGTSQNGILFGLYKSPSGSSVVTIYTAGWKHYSTFAEAQAWANVMLGGAAPLPVPTISSFTPTSGPVGTSVQILGTNFVGNTGVTLNNVAASHTTNFDTQITAVVPSTTTGTWKVTNTNGTGTSASSFTVASPAAAANFATGNQIVQHRGVYEVVLTGNGGVSNPYDTICNATFTPPSGSGAAKVVQAFWDGGNVWRVRCYANETGTWTYSTSSTDSGLNGVSGTFTCTASTSINYIRGKLHPHPTNSRRWASDDGQTLIGLGTTEYNLFGRFWDNGTTAISTATFQTAVSSVAGKGCNLIFSDINGGGFEDPAWSNHWSDSNHDIPHLSAFQTTDSRLQYMLVNYPNLYVNMTLMAESPNGFNTDTTLWATLTAAKKNRLLRYIVARWAAFPQITWCVVNDTNYALPNNNAMTTEVGTFLQTNDKWNNLRGTGPKRGDTNPYPSAAWNTYIRIETGSALEAAQVAAYSGFTQHVYNSEDVYEGDGITNPPYFFRWLAISWILSGGTATYGNDLWDRLTPYSSSGYTGLNSFPNVAQYFAERAVDTADFVDADSLVQDTDGATGARKVQAMRHTDNDQFIIYHPNSAGAGITASLKGTDPRVTVNLTSYPGTWDVEWYSVSGAVSQTAAPTTGGASRTLTSPHGATDALLRLTLETTLPSPPPLLQSATVVDSTLTLTYNVPLDPTSTPNVGDYTVFKNSVAAAPASLAVFGSQVLLTLSAATVFGDTVQISYSQVSGREVQDLSGNAAVDLNHQAVTNGTGATTLRLVNQARVVNQSRIAGGERTAGAGGGG